MGEGGTLRLDVLYRTHTMSFIDERSQETVKTFEVNEFETCKEVIDRVFEQKGGRLWKGERVWKARLLDRNGDNEIFWEYRPSVQLLVGDILDVIEVPLIENQKEEAPLMED